MASLYSNNSIKRNKNKNKMVDSVPYRIEFIKNLLHGKSIKPLVDFDNTDTECFVGGHKSEHESGDSYDTRTVLRKQFCDFTKVIMQIGNGMEDQLEYIKSGTSGHTFHGKVIDESGKTFEYGVKVVAYPRKEEYGDMYDVRRPENAELKMIKVLSYFVVKELTPHIVLPIGTFDTDIKTFIAPSLQDVVGRKNTKYKEFLQKYENGEYYDKVSILMSEWANRGDLLDFFRKHHDNAAFTPHHWKSIFFQFLSVLATIQEKYPGFKHNDLKGNNILVHKIPMVSGAITYRIGKNKYKIENIGYQIKLWDFDFACIPGVVDNKKVELRWTKKINATSTPNRYYDIHYFFNTLIKRGFCPEIMTSDQVPQEVKDFINRVLPRKYQNDPRATKLKNFIEEILPEKHKSQEIGSNFINNCYVPSNIKRFIIDNLPEKYRDIRIGVVHERGRLLVDDEYTTPIKILEEDPYFEEYRIRGNKNKQTLINAKKALSKAGDAVPKAGDAVPKAVSSLEQNTDMRTSMNNLRNDAPNISKFLSRPQESTVAKSKPELDEDDVMQIRGGGKHIDPQNIENKPKKKKSRSFDPSDPEIKKPKRVIREDNGIVKKKNKKKARTISEFSLMSDSS